MRKKVMLVAIILVVLIIGFSVTKLFSANSHKSALRNVSDEFISDILTRKTTESYNLFTTDEQKQLDKSIWATKVYYLSGFFSGKNPEFKDLTTGANLQVSTYSLVGKDGTYDLSVGLKQVGEVWRVDSFASKLEEQ